jgi:hypothetical protein
MSFGVQFEENLWRYVEARVEGQDQPQAKITTVKDTTVCCNTGRYQNLAGCNACKLQGTCEGLMPEKK